MTVTVGIQAEQAGEAKQPEHIDFDSAERALVRKQIVSILGSDLPDVKATVSKDLTCVETDAYAHLNTIVSRLNKAMEGKYSKAISDKYHEEIKKIKLEK